MANEEEVLQKFSAFGRGGDEDSEVSEMRKNRRINMRTASAATVARGRGGASISFATQRPRDPMFYWKNNNLPFDWTKPEELLKIREFSRIIYATHPVIGSAIDIFAKYPLTGMELQCKDDALTDFYTTLFFDELNYEEFLVDIGREYWMVGEVWPLGSFNETLGVWDDDELINPDDVDVIRSPFLREPRFEMRLPEVLRDIIQNREPHWEFEMLMRGYPELKNFINEEARMPVSNVLLKQIKFKLDYFSPRGLPILLRAFRAIMQEEMLNAAQDAVADRLYTPLILTKLGASANDLGISQPWIPSEGDISDFEEALDAALAGDFRMLTYHFAVDIQTVFGRENMPRMEADFDRLTDRMLQVFGLSKTMLSGAQQGTTYASDAINRDLISQLLSHYQKIIQSFFHERALVVAEAQEHYDYEERGGKRYVIMEEVLEVDEETGEERIVEQPKLLVPELKLKAMTMKDEQDLRQFIEALRASGVPISMKTRLMNAPVDLEDEIQRVRDEQIEQAVEAQETRKATYLALRNAGLPIPDDLRDDFEPKASQEGGDTKAEEQPVPTIGIVEPADTMGLMPTAEDVDPEGAGIPDEGGGSVVTLPRNRMNERTRPAESDEQRATMPKPAFRLRTVSTKIETAEDGTEVTSTKDTWSEEPTELEEPEGKHRLLSGPSHVGKRRHVKIDPDRPLDEQLAREAASE